MNEAKKSRILKEDEITLELYKSIISAEPTGESIGLGTKQNAYSDDTYTAVGFKLSYDYGDINPFSLVDCGNPKKPKLVKDAIWLAVNEIFKEKGSSSYGKLRWSTGASVVEVIQKTHLLGIAIVSSGVGLCD